MTTSTYQYKSATRSAAAPETYEALLFEPSEAAREFNITESATPAFQLGDWVLLATVPSAFSAALRMNSRNFQSCVSIAETPSGASYVSIINQARSFQCRILMPLFEPKVAKMFSGAKPAVINVSLAAEDSNEANGFRASFCEDQVTSAQRAIERMKTLDKKAVLDEVEDVIAEYQRLASFPSLQAGVELTDVCVVFALPFWVAEIEECLNQSVFSNSDEYRADMCRVLYEVRRMRPAVQ